MAADIESADTVAADIVVADTEAELEEHTEDQVPDEVPDTGMDSVRNYTDSAEAEHCRTAADLSYCYSVDPYMIPFCMVDFDHLHYIEHILSLAIYLSREVYYHLLGICPGGRVL